MARHDGRASDALRDVEIVPDYLRHPAGSVMIRMGDTRVICAASVEERVPPYVDEGSGWVTAEYAMLPRSTHTRSGRSPGGRGKEIQRLIGRSLRAAVDMKALGPRTITVDCDVLQADGGTRCASITGAWVALSLAVRRLEESGALGENAKVLGEPVAAISVGLVGGESRVDLCYQEDYAADVDMNVVATSSGKLIEVQGIGEYSLLGESAVVCRLSRCVP